MQVDHEEIDRGLLVQAGDRFGGAQVRGDVVTRAQEHVPQEVQLARVVVDDDDAPPRVSQW